MRMASAQDGLQFISDKVEMDQDHKQLTALRYGDKDAVSNESSLDVDDRMEKSLRPDIDGLRQKFDDVVGPLDSLDSMVQNFGRDAEGNLVYVDSVIPWGLTKEGKNGEEFDTERILLNFDVQKLRNSLHHIHDDKKRMSAERYLDRILVLAQAEAKKRNTIVDNL